MKPTMRLAVAVALLVGVAVGQVWATNGDARVTVGNYIFMDKGPVGTMTDPWITGPTGSNLDEGIAGVKVTLYYSTTGPNGDWTLYTDANYPDGTAVTGDDGHYAYYDVPSEDWYKVVVDTSTLPAGLTLTYNGHGSLSESVGIDKVTPNETVTWTDWSATPPMAMEFAGDWDFDFGYALAAEPVYLSGTVYRDCNGDGILQAGETLTLAGATITLYDDKGNQVGEPQVTGDDGAYAFGPLPAGTYRVVETDPAGFTSTGVKPGPGGSAPNNGQDHNTIVVEATDAGSSYPGMDFLDTGGEPEITLEKSGPTSAKRGETIVYHFTVTNTGNAMLDESVSDPMFGGVIWTQAGVKADESYTFDVTYTIPATGSLTGGAYTIGAASKVQALCTTPPPPPTCEEKLVNTATATGVSPCGTVTSTATWTVTVNAGGKPAISLQKTGPCNALRGQTVTYHFVVKNTGDVALDETVTDPMLGGVIWSKAAVAPGAVYEFDVTYAIPLTGDLKHGTSGCASGVQSLCYTRPPCSERLVNTATAQGVSACGNVSATASWTITINGSVKPGVCLTKTGPATAKRGDVITYTFRVVNTGTAVQTVTVDDPMLGGAIWTKAGVKPGAVDQFSVTYRIPLTGDLTRGTHGCVQTQCSGGSQPSTSKLVNTATAKAVAGCASASSTSSCTTAVSAASNNGGCGGRSWRPVLRCN